MSGGFQLRKKVSLGLVEALCGEAVGAGVGDLAEDRLVVPGPSDPGRRGGGPRPDLGDHLGQSAPGVRDQFRGDLVRAREVRGGLQPDLRMGQALLNLDQPAGQVGAL